MESKPSRLHFPAGWHVLLTLALLLFATGCTPPENPFVVAASTGLTAELDRAAAAGADINGRSKTSLTPLMVAVKWDHAEATEWLISHGAKLDLLDDDQDTALHIA